jgi:hypothetical protein
MKNIIFTRRVIRTEEVLEYVEIDLEEDERYLEMDEGVTIDKVSAWARSDNQDDQEKLCDFIWTNQCYGEVVHNDYQECHDVQVEEIFDIAEADE